MAPHVIPFGYSAPNAAQTLDILMQDERTVLVDIRYSTESRRKPAWSLTNLQARYGRRYVWLQLLGNVNYFQHGAPIEICNLEAGLSRLVNGLNKGYTLILLCTCARYSSCHCRVVVEALQEREPEVEVVQPEPVIGQADTIKCLSIRQPYASWLAHPQMFLDAGLPPKKIENRDWYTSYRGSLLIHASKQFEDNAIDYWQARFPNLGRAASLKKEHYAYGTIIGIADLMDVVGESDDPWFVGKYGFVLANARPIAPVSYRGQLRLFDVSRKVVASELYM